MGKQQGVFSKDISAFSNFSCKTKMLLYINVPSTFVHDCSLQLIITDLSSNQSHIHCQNYAPRNASILRPP